MGKFSCVYIKLTNLKYFPYIESTTTMDARLKHTEVTPLDPEHLKFTKGFKGFTDPLRGTLLPIFFLIYFGQDTPQGSIANDEEKSALAKLGRGYGLWVETASKAIDKFNEIEIVMDAYSAIDNMTEEAFYKKHFYGHYNEKDSLFIAKGPHGAITTVQSNAYPMDAKAIKKILSSSPTGAAPAGPSDGFSPNPSALRRHRERSCSQDRHPQPQVAPHLRENQSSQYHLRQPQLPYVLNGDGGCFGSTPRKPIKLPF
jgi:hypothetical protein